MSDKHVRRSGDNYRDVFLELLPQGQAWPKYVMESTLWKACDGLNQYWGTVDGRLADMLEIESDPRKTVELLPDWERNWGLPDPCEVYPPDTIALRQQELVYKMTLLGRQDRQYFIDMAARQGETITIREYAPYMCGVSRVGDTRGMYERPPPQIPDSHFRWQLGPPEMRFFWLVDLEHVLTGVECMFTRVKPAHSDVVFTYRSRLDRAISLYPWLMV